LEIFPLLSELNLSAAGGIYSGHFFSSRHFFFTIVNYLLTNKTLVPKRGIFTLPLCKGMHPMKRFVLEL
jgi:hypothetical protein